MRAPVLRNGTATLGSPGRAIGDEAAGPATSPARGVGTGVHAPSAPARRAGSATEVHLRSAGASEEGSKEGREKGREAGRRLGGRRRARPGCSGGELKVGRCSGEGVVGRGVPAGTVPGPEPAPDRSPGSASVRVPGRTRGRRGREPLDRSENSPESV